MSCSRQSDMFYKNFIYWKVLGLWSGRRSNENYKYYSFVYIVITLVIYNILLTLNLAFTPREIEYLIREIIFYFTEIAVTSKVFMIIFMRDKILEAFNLMDGTKLGADDENSRKIVQNANANFRTYWKYFAILSHVAYLSQVFVPVVFHFIFHTALDLPICKYYFLTDELRDKYFVFWYIYQAWGMFGHMIYNITVDSFMAGMILTVVVQIKILNAKMSNLKLNGEEKKLSFDVQEQLQMSRLRKSLMRYDAVLKFCNIIQDIIDVTMFVVFGMSALTICAVLCALLLPLSMETYVFMVGYLIAIILQIFVPAYLGTLLDYESTKLAFAAYSTEWLPRSEAFKRNIRVFVGRTNRPIQLKGLKMFPLSLSTFTSIIKSAYSFFAVIRSFQE